MREALRQRLWLMLAGLAIALVVALATMSAVDQSARLKLSIVIVTSVLGFAATLLAILVGASQLRRDLDMRIAIMLFSKPLPRIAYVLGRWLGVQLVVAAALAILCVVGSAIVGARFGGFPDMRRVVAPSGWQLVSATGELLPMAEDRTYVQLTGPPGNAARFSFSGLPAPGPHGAEVLLRMDVRALDGGDELQRTAVEVLAAPAGEPPWQVLALDAHSPYGAGEGSGDGVEPTATRQVLIRGRNQSHQDLSQDYCRLILPASCVRDGRSVVQVVRLDPRAGLLIDRVGGAYVAVPGGGFVLNLARAALVVLACSSVLTAATLAIASLSSLPVALLGGLTLFFCGSALHAVRESLRFDELSLPARRLLAIADGVFPDFDRYPIAAKLAAAEAVDWTTVASAWGYYGVFTVVLMTLAWIALARREV
ncbi:MAG: ABC transporter permease [Planctomycetes bacterium]|nr:ABC transporter permease [Planctomycetota bacterium]